MARKEGSEFVGETGPGAVINQYLPQPGQYTGRRILRINDTPKEFWRDTASKTGTPWAEALGLRMVEQGAWEIKKPELLTSTWFERRLRIPRGGSTKALQAAHFSIDQSAIDALAQQGSLRNWVARGATGTTIADSAARKFDIDPKTGATTTNTTPLTLDDSADDTPDANDADDATIAFNHSIREALDGIVAVPTGTWAGTPTTTPVDVSEPPQPTLFIIQVIGISSFLGDYGLGRTVKTFSLLPGETTTISTRTWRATEESVALASSIIDSNTDSASERFADTVMTETTDTATQDDTENWHAEAEVKGSFGFGSASVSGGGGGEYSSSTEEFAKSVDEAVSEHAAESSSRRENTVTSNSERSESTEDEEVIERTITNINVKRVLNFTFRELNQVYLTRTHLKEVRIAFSNGNSGSWREEPVSGMRKLVSEVISSQHVDSICQDLLRTIAVAFNIDGLPIHVLDQVLLDACGNSANITEARPGKDCSYAAPSADGRLYYRFRRGPLGQDPEDEHPVEGVLLKERDVVMATDSVVVESLLGQSDALDEYSLNLQVEAIRERQLANQRETMAQKIVTAKDADAAALYSQIFGTVIGSAPPQSSSRTSAK